MNDYNRGALPDPCMRLDYGFGEQWASVELGDGTGYVRLADYEKAVAENAKLREQVTQLQSDWESERDYADQMEAKEKQAVGENTKLRELVRDMWFWSYEGHMDSESQEWQMKHIDGVLDLLRELGVLHE